MQLRLTEVLHSHMQHQRGFSDSSKVSSLPKENKPVTVNVIPIHWLFCYIYNEFHLAFWLLGIWFESVVYLYSLDEVHTFGRS